jgi:hypothetical protein
VTRNDPNVNTPATEAALERVREYFATVQRGDSEAYAAQWIYPACVYTGGQWQALLNPAACRESNARYLADLRDMGVTGGRILELAAREAGPGAVWVDGRFSREAAAGRVIAETRASYLVVRSGDAWRVAVCVVRS